MNERTAQTKQTISKTKLRIARPNIFNKKNIKRENETTGEKQ